MAPFVQPRVAHRVLVVAPHRDLVQIGVLVLPAELAREERVAAAGVDDHFGADLLALDAVLRVGADADDARALHQHVADADVVPHLDALPSGVVEQHGVELMAPDLPRLRALVPDRLEEVERLRHLAGDRHELHAVLLRVRRRSQPVDDAEAVQREPRVGNQRLADVVAGARLALEQQHAMAVLGQQRADSRSRRTAADDDDIRLHHVYRTPRCSGRKKRCSSESTRRSPSRVSAMRSADRLARKPSRAIDCHTGANRSPMSTPNFAAKYAGRTAPRLSCRIVSRISRSSARRAVGAAERQLAAIDRLGVASPTCPGSGRARR